MRKIRLVIEYDGSAYVGWQTQANGISIQETVEKAISSVTGQGSTLHGSGRTDSGVHARAQVAHFETDVRMSADKFAFALNTFLPSDIRILFSDEAPADFHSRFSAKWKQYRYFVQLGPHADVFTRNTALHIHTKPDFQRMADAAQQIIGTHDFSAFMSSGSTVENTVRTVSLSEWHIEGNYLVYDICGNGFLYNMVRILVGTMLDIGSGRIPSSSIIDALESGKRSHAGSTAPAHGLILYRVKYEDFDTEDILQRL